LRERSSDPALWAAFQVSVAALPSPPPSRHPAIVKIATTIPLPQ